MTKEPTSYIKKYAVCALKYALYLFNLALLAGLGVKTVRLWIAEQFSFADIMRAYPLEPEFADTAAAKNQLWLTLGLETGVFILGGFLCYEFFIKQKTFRRSLTAPFVIVFLWAAGESVALFMPSLDKVQAIAACRAMDITWDTKNHRCRLMDLELRRFERLKAMKKSRPAVKPAVKKVSS